MPPIVLETSRLTLRPYADTDAARVLDVHSRLEVIRWLGDPPFVPMASLDEARTWIDAWREEKGPHDVGLAIEVRDTGVVAGTVMITALPNAEHEERQVGWHLHPDSVGHGYVTEAASALLDHAFAAGLSDVWCDMYADNDASAAVARRLGLPEVGVVPDPWYSGESRLFHVTAQQWQERRSGSVDRSTSGSR